jgi:hypothetical protein
MATSCAKVVCSCTYPTCEKHGKCCECVAFHRERGEIPGCFFTKEGEAFWKRDLDTFINDRVK